MSAARTDVELAARIATGLAAALRGVEVPVALSSEIEFAAALVALSDLERSGVYWAGRATFVHGPDEVAAYDRAFDRFFLGTGADNGLAVPKVVEVPEAAHDDEDGDEQERTGEEAGLRFSRAERLARADLGALSDDELAEIERLIDGLDASMARVVSRRLAPSTRATTHLDLRRSVASALRNDGEIVRRRYRRPRRRSRRVVVLFDVSGSMEPYARALLRFSHVVAAGRDRVEVFAMGTRLTRLTRLLHQRDADSALRESTAAVLDWSGGTRLGETLREFNDRYGLASAARSATVVICSDGIDRGDPELISEEMGRLGRVAHRVIWVNPLKATPGYEPLARGMAAALPFVDEFMAGESFASLERVARALAN